MAAIVTVDEVQEWTGVVVTPAQISSAQGVLGLIVGRDLGDEGWRLRVPYTRDQRHLQQAVAYQSAWLTAHPDAFTASDVAASSVDGAQQTFRDTGVVLAPLAAMALRRLSWKGSRTVTAVAAPVDTRVKDYTVSVLETWDDTETWRPM
jgi:hypothetical protein